ncbi:MAG TPA: hypothetical protein VLG46_14945 [Anaerolineae bacterium]|nr:hypothetical protein [Anaerolineae bacterium]
MVNPSIPIISKSADRATADLIDSACAEALQLIQSSWGLAAPQDCRIYVMTSWPSFVFQSAPWPWRVLLAVTAPFWSFRARRTWPYSAAWTQRYGKRVAIGIKPPRLLAQSDKSFGVRMFVEEKDMQINTRRLVCHELTHACAAHLRLPAWLNEGIATVTVDRFARKRTIVVETLNLIRDYQPKTPPPTYRALSQIRGEAFIYHAVRGYWLTAYVEEKCPGFLQRKFAHDWPASSIEQEIAIELGMRPENFWSEIDAAVSNHFIKMAG